MPDNHEQGRESVEAGLLRQLGCYSLCPIFLRSGTPRSTSAMGRAGDLSSSAPPGRMPWSRYSKTAPGGYGGSSGVHSFGATERSMTATGASVISSASPFLETRSHSAHARSCRKLFDGTRAVWADGVPLVGGSGRAFRVAGTSELWKEPKSGYITNMVPPNNFKVRRCYASRGGPPASLGGFGTLGF